jgi:hypothetical protein
MNNSPCLVFQLYGLCCSLPLASSICGPSCWQALMHAFQAHQSIILFPHRITCHLQPTTLTGIGRTHLEEVPEL